MAFSKIIAESMDLTDTYAFTGTVTGAGETNKPYFEAYESGLQQTNHNTTTKLTFGSDNMIVILIHQMLSNQLWL